MENESERKEIIKQEEGQWIKRFSGWGKPFTIEDGAQPRPEAARRCESGDLATARRVKLRKDAVSSSRQAEAELAAYMAELSDSDRLTFRLLLSPAPAGQLGSAIPPAAGATDGTHQCVTAARPAAGLRLAPGPQSGSLGQRAGPRAPGPGGSS